MSQREKTPEQTRQEWLASLKPGDQLMVQDRFSEAMFIAKVQRLTTTQILVGALGDDRRANGYALRFWKKDGTRISNNSWRASLQPLTEDAVQEIRRRDLIRDLRQFPWGQCDPETLDKVIALIKEQAPGLKDDDQKG